MHDFALFAIVFSWWTLVAYLVVRWWRARRTRAGSEQGRRTERASRYGMLYEALGIAIVFSLPAPQPPAPAWLLLSAILALGAALLGCAAAAQLGPFLRVQAVVTSDHELITGGPYAFVRHPIYASLLYLLIATGIYMGNWLALLIALPVFILGTELRVHCEDKLLAERFGPAFQEYRAKVPAYLPGLR